MKFLCEVSQKLLLFLIMFFTVNLCAINEVAFNRIWLSMQQQYLELSQQIDANGYRPLEEKYYHSYWDNAKNHVKQLILNGPNIDFLRDQVIGNTMVPMGMGLVQQYEISLIQDCVSKKVKDLIISYKEPDIGPHPRQCKEFDCSTNVLNKLSYAAKIIEIFDSPQLIVEFGSGYGCLAHVFKQLLPHSTLILIDIPEFLALQYLYLRYSSPENTIILHKEVPSEFKVGAIHLIPTHYINELKITADIFISTFAISESPLSVQKIIGDKNFFNAKVCYIAGQLYGWGGKFENHTLLLSAVRKTFSKALCIPFYYTLGNEKSYELIASNF